MPVRKRNRAASAEALITNDTMTEPMRMLESTMTVVESTPTSDRIQVSSHELTQVSSAPMMSAAPKMIAARRSRAFSRT